MVKTSMQFRNVCANGINALMNCKAAYINAQADPLNLSLLTRYMEVFTIIISPICPHLAEHLWTILKKDGTCAGDARFPVAGPVDALLLRKVDYLRFVASDLRISP